MTLSNLQEIYSIEMLRMLEIEKLLSSSVVCDFLMMLATPTFKRTSLEEQSCTKGCTL